MFARVQGLGVLLLALLAAAAASALPAPARAEELVLLKVFGEPAFRKPVLALPAPDGGAWYVVEQRGVVWRIVEDEAGLHRTLFVDLRERVESGPNEAGLLGMAFHPRFAANGTVYLSYTAPGSPLLSRIAVFASPDHGRTLEPASERLVLALDQPYSNHNGGHIAFGPDGFLYVGFGDGGSGGDPHGNGQNPDTLLGKLLRLDVDGGAPYAIPADNPFARGGGRPEIFATGLRNPWRFSFDRETGALWLADVGQNDWEEIDLVEGGGNYGWNIREGAHCFKADTCRGDGLSDPVAEYGHDAGCSVTGGHVYRGPAIPALAGAYLYADYCSGTLWGLFPRAGSGAPATGASPSRERFEAPRALLETGLNVSSFGEGPDGELYLIDHGEGAIHRLIAH
jgi:glucose/arabinose dehydrogenase